MTSLSLEERKTGRKITIPDKLYEIDEEGQVILKLSPLQLKKLREGKQIREPAVYNRTEEEKKEKHKECVKRWHQENKERVASIRREYYKNKCEKDPEFKARQNEIKKQQYWNNREKILERQIFLRTYYIYI